MQPHEFLKQISDGKGYLRANAIDVIERISNKDFNDLMSSFATALTWKPYSADWSRTDKIRHVLAYIGPCRTRDVVKEIEKLDGIEYPLKEKQAYHATISTLAANGKLTRTDHLEKPVYSL